MYFQPPIPFDTQPSTRHDVATPTVGTHSTPPPEISGLRQSMQVHTSAYDEQRSVVVSELWCALSTALAARRDQTVFTDRAGHRTGRAMLREVADVSRRLDAITPNGATIAVVGQRGYGSLIALLPCLATDRPYMPLDLEWPPQRTELVLRESGAAAVVTVGHDQELAITGRAPVHTLRDRIADLAYVIFTSGSTGVPKGVMVESEVLRRRLAALVPIITEWCTPAMMLNTSIAFDISLIELLRPLLAGGVSCARRR